MHFKSYSELNRAYAKAFGVGAVFVTAVSLGIAYWVNLQNKKEGE